MHNLNDTTNTKLQQALHYLKDKKWSVIPIGDNKTPLISWKKFQTEWALEEEVVGWFKKYPQANIAVVTGKISNLAVVDIDPRHDGSDEYFKDVATVKVRTGGDGFHLYFRYEEGIQNHAGVKPGIDIRGEGGYVIVPPSIHPSGKPYEWLVDPDNQIAAIPKFLKDWITEWIPVGSSSKWKEEVLNGVSEGQRNNTAASVAGKLLKRHPQSEWNTEAWMHLKNWNEAKNKPPLPDSELRQVFKSIAQRELRNIRGTETPQIAPKQPLITTELTYQEVENKVSELLPNSQNAFKIVLAVAVSCAFKNNVMLWLLLVGVPSSGKTDLVRLIKNADVSYYLDNLTQNAFISGERSTNKQKVYDLLPLIHKKCLIIKDWTSIFSLDEKMTKKLLGELVGIYDKEFTKFSSRRGNISYLSEFSQLGCITPATLNRHTNYMNMVGPRFLCYTMPTTTFDEENLSYERIFSNSDRSLIEKDARLYASSYLNQLIQQSPNIKPLTQNVREYLRTAAKLMSNCRGIVLLQSATFKNEDGEDIKYYEVLDVQIEEPWRAVQQLISLAKYLAFAVGKDEISVDELKLIKEVVISSMPADRSQALRLIKEQGGELTAKELSDVFEKSVRTSRRLLEELFALKALDKDKGIGSIATDYKIASQFKDFLLLDPTEFMSSYSSGTETPQGIELSEKEAPNESIPY